VRKDDMITTNLLSGVPRVDSIGYNCGLGNDLFKIAGIIGIATKNGYSYGFRRWQNQEYFVNPLPILEETLNLKNCSAPANYKGYDVGFSGFNFPDNSIIKGQFASENYFGHCKDLIRYYFTLKEMCDPYKDCIVIHCRDFDRDFVKGANNPFAKMDYEYFHEALKKFPSKRVIVVTDDAINARNIIKEDFEYVNSSAIRDFYVLTQADYLILSNGTFSWWGAWLSKAKTVVAPSRWFVGEWRDCPLYNIYPNEWIVL
jgi:hypothetical protein